MKRFAIVAATLLVVLGAGSLAVGVLFKSPPQEGNGEKFSVETTRISRLLDTPCTRLLFEKKLGAAEQINSPVFYVARHLTMRRLSEFPFSGINEQKLRAIQMEFSRLDPSAVECQIKSSDQE